MQTSRNLSDKELILIISDFFKKRNEKVKSVSFHQSEIDRPGDIKHTYATVSFEEELKFDDPCSQR